MMIQSMTGYGSSRGELDGLPVSLEIRSVNNRYLDLNVHLPRSLLFAEAPLRELIQERLKRGKVDVYLNLVGTDSAFPDVKINQAVAEAYLKALETLGTQFELETKITALQLANLPEVMTLQKNDPDQERFLSDLAGLAKEALEDFVTMREREGEKLREDLLRKADHVEELVEEIEKLAPETVAAYRARLESKIRETLEDRSFPEERLLTEVAIFSDRVATDEELVRLRSHLHQFRGLLAQGSPVGRKLDFLVQEFNREANTIGSKCLDSAIARQVVELKSEIERIREQIQNLE